MAFARRVHDRGLQILQQAGFKRQSPCEAIGDCWMISIMAGHDARIPIDNIQHFPDARRKGILTKTRSDLFKFLTTVPEDASKGLTAAEIKKVAACLGVADLPREHTTIGARASKEVDRVGHTNRLQHPGGIIGPPRPFSS